MMETTASCNCKIKFQRTMRGSKKFIFSFQKPFLYFLAFEVYSEFFFLRKMNVLSAFTLTKQLFSLFSSLHGITFTCFCCFPGQSMFTNLQRDALRNASTLLTDNLNISCDLLRSKRWRRKGLWRQGGHTVGSPGSPQDSGVALPGGHLSVGCCDGRAVSSAGPYGWLESSWVLQLRAGLLRYPQHIPVSRRPVDTSSLIYGHGFVVRSWCLQDSADFTLA